MRKLVEPMSGHLQHVYRTDDNTADGASPQPLRGPTSFRMGVSLQPRWPHVYEEHGASNATTAWKLQRHWREPNGAPVASRPRPTLTSRSAPPHFVKLQATSKVSFSLQASCIDSAVSCPTMTAVSPTQSTYLPSQPAAPTGVATSHSTSRPWTPGTTPGTPPGTPPGNPPGLITQNTSSSAVPAASPATSWLTRGSNATASASSAVSAPKLTGQGSRD